MKKLIIILLICLGLVNITLADESKKIEGNDVESSKEIKLEELTKDELKKVVELYRSGKTVEDAIEIINKQDDIIYNEMTLTWNGIVTPYINSQGQMSAPTYGSGIWRGTGLVSDGMSTHFMGHNPGDFYWVLSVGIGDSITVTDHNGGIKKYEVYDIIRVNDYGEGIQGQSYMDYILYDYEERILLQACIDDFWNIIVFAR